MTPEQIELARRAMALPGAPRGPGGCILWTWWLVPEQVDRIPDFNDLTGATDGVLLKLLGPKVAVYYSYTNLEWVVAIPFSGVIARAPYLAEACCRAAVALGRWPGGTATHEAKAEV